MGKYLRVHLLGPGPRLMKKEFTGPRSHKGWETLVYTPQCKAKCGVSNSKQGWDAEIRWETAWYGRADAWFMMIANHSPRVWRAVGQRRGPGQTQWANNGASTPGPAPPSSGCCLKHKTLYIKGRTKSYRSRKFYALRYRWFVWRNRGRNILPSVIWQKMNDRFYFR